MDRRTFVTSGVLAAPASALAAPALSQGRIQWRMPTSFPARAPGVGTNAVRFAEIVGELSGGRLTLQVFSGGELVPPFAVEDAVQQGTAEIGHSTPYYSVGKNSAQHFFTTIPFGMHASELDAWLRHGGGQALWDEVAGQRGLKPFLSGNSTTQAAGWFKSEINSVDDLQGLNMRIAGLGGEAMRKLGVNAVLLPPAEIFPAFQSGSIDAAEWVGPALDQAFGLNKVAEICYLPAFHEPSAGLEIVVNRDAYDGLPEDLRAIIRYAAAAAHSENLAEFEFLNTQAFAQLKADGVRFLPLPADVLAALKDATAEVLDEQAEANPDFARVRESYDAFLAKAQDYGGAMTAPSMMQRL